MVCENCGNVIDDDAAVCPSCGAKTAVAKTVKQKNTLAIVGFVLSFFIPFVGIICSSVALHRARKHNARHKGLAIAGIIIGIVMFFVLLYLLMYFFGVLTLILALRALGETTT